MQDIDRALQEVHDHIEHQHIAQHLEVSVDDVLLVQVLNGEEHLSCIEPGTFFWKPACTMLRQCMLSLQQHHSCPGHACPQ